LAAGENLEARIRGNTGRTKARGKIDVDGMFRTEEEKRKLENRAAAVSAALEDIRENPGSTDAQAEIEDDWLNLFARLTEEKSSEELRCLFGKILAGEIKKPGSFSLRTIQVLATLSKDEATQVSDFLSYAINAMVVPCQPNGPTDGLRILMEELGIAGHPSQIGGVQLTSTIRPGAHGLYLASHLGILINNNSEREVGVAIPGQVLTASARELAPIANSPPTDIEFLKKVASDIYSNLRGDFGDEMDAGLLAIHVVATHRIDDQSVRSHILYTVPKP
jgi:hypothetical protein